MKRPRFTSSNPKTEEFAQKATKDTKTDQELVSVTIMGRFFCDGELPRDYHRNPKAARTGASRYRPAARTALGAAEITTLAHQVKLPGLGRQDFYHEIRCAFGTCVRQDSAVLIRHN